MSGLDLSCKVSYAGDWVELEDEDSGYTLGAKSFSAYTRSAKQLTVGDDMLWLRGEIVRASAPHNVTELIEVNVAGDTHYEFEQRRALLEWIFTEQLIYQVKRVIEDSLVTWNCLPCADVSLATQVELIHATTGVLTFQVPRLPDVTLERV